MCWTYTSRPGRVSSKRLPRMHFYLKLANTNHFAITVLKETMSVITQNPRMQPLRSQIQQIRAESGIGWFLDHHTGLAASVVFICWHCCPYLAAGGHFWFIAMHCRFCCRWNLASWWQLVLLHLPTSCAKCLSHVFVSNLYVQPLSAGTIVSFSRNDPRQLIACFWSPSMYFGEWMGYFLTWGWHTNGIASGLLHLILFLHILYPDNCRSDHLDRFIVRNLLMAVHYFHLVHKMFMARHYDILLSGVKLLLIFKV